MLVRLRHLLRAPRLIFVLSAVNAYKGAIASVPVVGIRYQPYLMLKHDTG